MSPSDPLDFSQGTLQFQYGKRHFEAGRYKEAIHCLNQACALVEPQSKSAGEIRLWLVTAYDASGKREEALSLCRQLTQTPYVDIRKQAKRLLTILEAPKLAIHDDWVTTIPPLDDVNEPGRIEGASHRAAARPPSPKHSFLNDQEVDMSQVTTSDRGLALMASVLVVFLGLGLIWLAQ